MAIDEWSAGQEVEVVGLPAMQGYRAGLAELAMGMEWMSGMQTGAVEHVRVPLGEDEAVMCVTSGIWLARDDGEPVVVTLRSADTGMRADAGPRGRPADHLERALAELRAGAGSLTGKLLGARPPERGGE